MPYTEDDKEKFLSNYISYEKEKKHYFCYICNKYIIKPEAHIKTTEHKESEADLKDVDFKIYF
jgi:hypothetical protein